jgi:hypothetical protein
MGLRKWILLIVFLFLASWDLWEALGNLLGLPPYYEAVGFADFVPWWLLIAGLVIAALPPVLGIWWVRRSRSIFHSAIGLALLLSTHAAVSLSVLAWEQAWRAQVLLGLLS